jgi:hypothetical protein
VAAPLTPGIDPRRIEAEIVRVREREAGGFGGGVKTSLFNLVVASPPGERVENEVDGLLGRRPARIIRISREPAVGVGASVSGRCSVGTLDQGVCLEEIDLAAGEDPLGAGAGAWTPLLVHDIPTFLWLAGRWTPAGLPSSDCEAAAHADKLIVDSSRTDDPTGAFRALRRLRAATRGRLTVADLAWSRTLPMRVQAARAFEPPAARDALDSLTSVRIEGAEPAEALLFFLWLASRLAWQPVEGGAAPKFRDAAGRAVTLVHEAPGPLARGLRLWFIADGRTIEVSCSANGCAEIEGDRGPWRIVSDRELLLGELDVTKQDPLLEHALGAAGGAAGVAGAAREDSPT